MKELLKYLQSGHDIRFESGDAYFPVYMTRGGAFAGPFFVIPELLADATAFDRGVLQVLVASIKQTLGEL